MYQNLPAYPGNLYPALNDIVVGTCIDPNKRPEVTSEHNLETSII